MKQMNNQVTYRKFRKSDIQSLVKVIIKNWKYDEILSKSNANRLTYAFLYFSLANAEFIQIAEVSKEAVGIIIGNTQAVPLKNKLNYLKVLKYGLPMLFSKEGRNILKVYGYQTTFSINRKMFNQVKHHSFEGEVALFAVSEEVQGMGIGSHLFDSFLNYLEQNEANRFFLYTDTSCNYGFYDYKNLERIASKKVVLSKPFDKKMEYYIYKGERKKLNYRT